jgi:hypothetical protein
MDVRCTGKSESGAFTWLYFAFSLVYLLGLGKPGAGSYTVHALPLHHQRTPLTAGACTMCGVYVGCGAGVELVTQPWELYFIEGARLTETAATILVSLISILWVLLRGSHSARKLYTTLCSHLAVACARCVHCVCYRCGPPSISHPTGCAATTMTPTSHSLSTS